MNRAATGLDKYRYIVVEGPIGVGKTSLARRLAEHLNAGLLLEQPEQNPFLARFYQDMERYALPTQLFFLFQRVDQLRELAQIDMFQPGDRGRFPARQGSAVRAPQPRRRRIARCTSRSTRTSRRRRRGRTSSSTCRRRSETLVERVRRRGVEFERPISEAYLARLADSYNRFFYHYDGAPVLIVNSERLNFVDRPADLDLLLERIAAMRGQREFFNLGEYEAPAMDIVTSVTAHCASGCSASPTTCSCPPWATCTKAIST